MVTRGLGYFMGVGWLVAIGIACLLMASFAVRALGATDSSGLDRSRAFDAALPSPLAPAYPPKGAGPEIESERTRTSKTFASPDGQHVARIYAE